MAAGDLITLNHQYEYRGILFGSGTQLMVTEVRGLLSTPGVKSQDHDRSGVHGESDAPLLMGPRFIEVTMKMLSGPTDADVVHQNISNAFLPTQENHQFVFSRPATGSRYVDCRVHDRVIPSTYELARGTAEINIMLKATNPVIYGLEEKVTEWDFLGIVVHGGNWTMQPVLEIPYPAHNPRITHNSNDRTISIGGPFDVLELSSGETLIVDTKERTVMLNGVDQYNKVRIENEWWHLTPGNNQISNEDSSGPMNVREPGGIIRVRHRDTWM